MPDYPCGKSGKCHGPRASEGPQEIEKNCQGFEYPKTLSMGPCMQKLDYEIGRLNRSLKFHMSLVTA